MYYVCGCVYACVCLCMTFVCDMTATCLLSAKFVCNMPATFICNMFAIWLRHLSATFFCDICVQHVCETSGRLSATCLRHLSADNYSVTTRTLEETEKNLSTNTNSKLHCSFKHPEIMINHSPLCTHTNAKFPTELQNTPNL